MRHKWISPFGLYGSLMWRNKHQRKTNRPGEMDKSEKRLLREAVGNGTGNPSVIATES